jgi:hypothetical protein
VGTTLVGPRRWKLRADQRLFCWTIGLGKRLLQSVCAAASGRPGQPCRRCLPRRGRALAGLYIGELRRQDQRVGFAVISLDGQKGALADADAQLQRERVHVVGYAGGSELDVELRAETSSA